MTQKLRVNADAYPIVEEDVRFYFQGEDWKADVDAIIDSIRESGYKSIVILTVKTVQTSILKDHIPNGKNRNIDVASCREFKGLEADAILLIDVDEQTFCHRDEETGDDDNSPLLFYVGASRARLSLRILADLSAEACRSVLENYFDEFEEELSVKTARKQLVRKMKAHYSSTNRR